MVTTTKTKSKKTKTIIDEDGNEHVEILEDVSDSDEKVEFLDPEGEEEIDAASRKRTFSKSQKSEDFIDSVLDEAP